MAYSVSGMERQPRIRPEPLPAPDPAAAGKQAAIDSLLVPEDGPTGPPEVEPYWVTNPGAYNRLPNQNPGTYNSAQRGGGMGLGLSRFASALNNNETDTLGRYGESPLFSGLMLQAPAAAAETSPETDLLQDFRARRTGGVSPYRRRAIDALLGGA